MRSWTHQFGAVLMLQADYQILPVLSAVLMRCGVCTFLHRTSQCTMTGFACWAQPRLGFFVLFSMYLFWSCPAGIGRVCFFVFPFYMWGIKTGIIRRIFQRLYKTPETECSFPDPDIQGQHIIFRLFLPGAQLCLQPRRDNIASIMAECSHPSRSPPFFRKTLSVCPFLFRINCSLVVSVETVLIVGSNKQKKY